MDEVQKLVFLNVINHRRILLRTIYQLCVFYKHVEIFLRWVS